MEQLGLLRKAIANIKIVENESGSFSSNWSEQYGIVSGYLDFANSRLVGFTPIGATTVAQLVTTLFEEDKRLRLGLQHRVLYKHLIDRILHRYVGAERVTHEELRVFKNELSAWFNNQISKFSIFIPCRIMPREAAPIQIGPVVFTHLNQVSFSDAFASQVTFEVFKENVNKTARRESADWLAQVDIDDREESKAQEVADIAVDLALAVLQVVLGPSHSKNIVRTSGWSPPRLRERLVVSDGKMLLGGINESPGLSLTADAFQLAITHNQAIFDAMANRISAYVAGIAEQGTLDLSWCDAAYWFHQGVSETLDSVSIPKIATSMEVLFVAESSKYSSKRLRDAFKAFFNLNPNQEIAQDPPLTTNRFISLIGELRSRVLHGTASTIDRPFLSARADITSIAAQFLAVYAFELDAYNAQGGQSENMTAFLEFVRSRRCPVNSTNTSVKES